MALDRKDTGNRFSPLDARFMAKLEEIEYLQTAQEIAIEITSNFPPSIFSRDLERLIIKAIDSDRKRVREWADQQS